MQTELKVVVVDWPPEELAKFADSLIQTSATSSWLNLLLRALALYCVDDMKRIASGVSKKSIELQMNPTRLDSTHLFCNSILFVSCFIAAKLLNLLWLCEPQGRFATSPQNPKQFKNIRQRLSTVTIQKYSPAPVSLSAPPFHGNLFKYGCVNFQLTL